MSRKQNSPAQYKVTPLVSQLQIIIKNFQIALRHTEPHEAKMGHNKKLLCIGLFKFLLISCKIASS